MASSPGPSGWLWEVLGAVGGVRDPGQPRQGWVAVEVEGVMRISKVHSPPWWVTGRRGVEAAGLERCYDQDLVGGDVADLGVEWSWLTSLVWVCAHGEASAGHGWLATIGRAVAERLAGDGAVV